MIGDGDVIQNIRFVRAKGTVVIEGKKEYNKYLSKTYQKHGTLRNTKRMCIVFDISKIDFFA